MGGSDPNERYDIPHADILFEDVWAEAGCACPSCQRDVKESDVRCPACGQWLDRCHGSCASCGSPRCVGGERD